jgi:hypothetical protein
LSQKKGRELNQKELADYAGGLSVREISINSELGHSSIRQRLEDMGLIRNKADATKLSRARDRNLSHQSRLTVKENGESYDAKMSQSWLSRGLVG